MLYYNHHIPYYTITIIYHTILEICMSPLKEPFKGNLGFPRKYRAPPAFRLQLAAPGRDRRDVTAGAVLLEEVQGNYKGSLYGIVYMLYIYICCIYIYMIDIYIYIFDMYIYMIYMYI